MRGSAKPRETAPRDAGFNPIHVQQYNVASNNLPGGADGLISIEDIERIVGGADGLISIEDIEQIASSADEHDKERMALRCDCSCCNVDIRLDPEDFKTETGVVESGLWSSAPAAPARPLWLRPKIAGAVVLALLIVGGGIYAYQSSSRTITPRSQSVAMKNPVAVPTNMATNNPTAPRASAPTPPATPPAPSSPHVVNATRAETPARATKKSIARIPRTSSSAYNLPSADMGINAPMTLTPETAPPPQPEQAAPRTARVQTVMQPPPAVPNVSGAAN